jgi:ATP-dependent DNA helicase DinG
MPGKDITERDPVFSPEGVLGRALENYEPRSAQATMAAAVARALHEGRKLVVEAGTGTGKTLAYLVPALRSGLKVVVSTGTRNLQEQILRKDLPLVGRLLGRQPRAVALKGLTNYLCLRRLEEARHSLPLLQDGDLARVQDWAQTSPTGDRAELDLPEDSTVWRDVCATTETRIGPTCPHFEPCFVTRARRAAAEAELVVVNHHLFFADLALRSRYPGAQVLPPYEAVIFDEAHQIEEVATEYFGRTVSALRFITLSRDLRRAAAAGGLGEVETLARKLEEGAADLFALVRRQLPDAGGDKTAIPDGLFAAHELQRRWHRTDAALEELEAHAAAAPGREDAQQLARRAGDLRESLAEIAEPSPHAGAFVRWAERGSRGVSLHSAPVEVGPILSEALHATVEGAVFTSATLMAAGTFSYFLERVGLSGPAVDAVGLPSPFDFPRQAMLYVPRDLPDPRADGFALAVAERARELCAITEGRAFLLFTSYRNLEAVAARLVDLPYPVLVQGDRPAAALLDQFRATPGAVLLATGSFWEGVDVVGEALSLVVIDKLPFSPPDDPLVAARSRLIEERGGDAFSTYHVPRAALALKQGFGRLIRHRDDRGIVAILDGRLLGRPYGRAFLATLPDCARTSDLAEAAAWWRGGGR